MTLVRAALVQQSWAGSKEAMVDNAVLAIAEAAAQGAQVVCLQELFYGPYFCDIEDESFFAYAETVPGGPTTSIMREVARTHGLVLIVPMYEHHGNDLYNTAAVIDADGSFLGRYRKNHIPNTKGHLEKFYFRPGDLGYPVFDTAAGRIGVYICYDRHFPEGWRGLGLAGAQMVFNPSGTSRSLSHYVWHLTQPAAAVANSLFIGALNRVGHEGPNDFYGESYFVDPNGSILGEKASDTSNALVIRDLDLSLITAARERWAFYRDRRPDSYQLLVQQ